MCDTGISGERETGCGKNRAVQHGCALPLNPPSRSGNEVNAQLFLCRTNFRKVAEKLAPKAGLMVKMTGKHIQISVFRRNARAT
jgi:hypothetical protein